MKKLLVLLLLGFFLPLEALSDAPAGFSDELRALADREFAARCEAALMDTTLAGSAVAAWESGEIALARDEYDAFVVMYRPDGLMMLCHFLTEGEGLRLDWHNDLLLSCYQNVALGTKGADWSGGSIPHMEIGFDTLRLTLEQGDGTRLILKCEGLMHYEPWRVTEMQLWASPDGTNWRVSLILPEDCLAEDIYLATCEPSEWRRGETEEAVAYGW